MCLDWPCMCFWSFRAERQEWLLQKEKVELQHRLTNLRQGQAFLCDVIELNRLYLDYQHKHPTEKEMVLTHNPTLNINVTDSREYLNARRSNSLFFFMQYGASSLPALLLETKLKSRVWSLVGRNGTLHSMLCEHTHLRHLSKSYDYY